MSNLAASILFIFGVFLGLVFGAFAMKIKKAGTIQITQYDDQQRTTWQLIFDVSPDDLENLKKVAFNINKVNGNSSQK